MPQTVSIWKASVRGLGERHLAQGYPAEDFPGRPFGNGKAYFAADRELAAQYASPDIGAYEDFVIEIAIPVEDYERTFRKFETPLATSEGVFNELPIPTSLLETLNGYPRTRRPAPARP